MLMASVSGEQGLETHGLSNAQFIYFIFVGGPTVHGWRAFFARNTETKTVAKLQFVLEAIDALAYFGKTAAKKKIVDLKAIDALAYFAPGLERRRSPNTMIYSKHSVACRFFQLQHEGMIGRPDGTWI